jgi:hypothetical protein
MEEEFLIKGITFTQFIAFWGAIISSLALGWNILRRLQDRKKLKLEANIGTMLPGDPSKIYFYITMTNIGRRPVFVTGWGADLKKEKKEKRAVFIKAHDLPKLLKDGEAHMEYIEDLSIFSRNIKNVKVWDSTGKKWKISKKNFKRLLKNAKEVLQQNQT